MIVQRRRPGRQPSQAIVEFAFSVPVFLLLLLGLIDFSRAIFTYITLVNGTREMARSLSIPATNNATAIAAFQDLVLVLGTTNASTDHVTVTVYNKDGTPVALPQGAQTGACTLPLSTASCTVPARAGHDGGWVDVSETYTFNYAPQFRAPFNVAFMEPATVLSSTARAYIE